MDKRNIATTLGLEAEKQFELECIKRNIGCYLNIGISQSDYVIETDTLTLRVQIKSSDSNKKNNIPIKCSWGTAKTGWKSYTKEQTDIVAAYVRKTKDWYIIPVERVSEILGFNISNECKFSKYKNNWKFKINKPIKQNNIFDEAKHLKNKGLNNTYIAARLNKSRSYIDRLLRDGSAGIKDRLNFITKDKLLILYEKENNTMETIAKHFNVSTWTIRKKFREYSINIKKNNNPNGIKCKTSIEPKGQ